MPKSIFSPSRIDLPFLSFLLLSHLQLVATDSTISTFTDDSCQDSSESFTGPNGYPNGTCTELQREGDFGSFQIVELDEGCSVTIYGKDSVDDQLCSSTVIEVAQKAKCYDSSFVYYSIDMCTNPDLTSKQTTTQTQTQTSTHTPTSTVSSNTSSARTTSTSTSTSTSISTFTTSDTPNTPIPNTGPSASSNPPQSSSPDNLGAIIGGVIGGVAFGGIIVGLVFFFWFRSRQNKTHEKQSPPKDLPEYSMEGSAGLASPVSLNKPPEYEPEQRGNVLDHGRGNSMNPVELEAGVNVPMVAR